MIVSSAIQAATAQPSTPLEGVPDPGGSVYSGRIQTKSKQVVSPETAKRIATYYRCLDTITDDIAAMPLQQFVRTAAGAQRVAPDPTVQNMAYLIEVRPNRWMTPFILKKTLALWLLSWGKAMIWRPAPPAPSELFILPANTTHLRFDRLGNLWYEVHFPNGERKFIPSAEVMKVIINSTNGIDGRSVLEYARDTVGLRQGMSETQSGFQAGGMKASAYIQVGAALDRAGRASYREAYNEVLGGSDNAGGLAVFDNKVIKFEPITMKFTDAQFLETMQSTDLDIANYFKFPAYKLNMGKQSYESNEQQDLDYLRTCLDPHLVQIEQSARLAWLPEADQVAQFWKFQRSAILRTRAKDRAELHEVLIRSGQLTPNDARAIEDRDAYPLGNKYWMTRNNAEIGVPDDVNA